MTSYPDFYLKYYSLNDVKCRRFSGILKKGELWKFWKNIKFSKKKFGNGENILENFGNSEILLEKFGKSGNFQENFWKSDKLSLTIF